MSRSHAITAAAVLALLGAGGLRADLGKARAETQLGKRARLALDNAAAELRAASGFYGGGDWEKMKAALGQVRESVELAYVSLRQAGKTPRNSNDYKNMEIKTRRLLKDLEDFRLRMGVDEREPLVSVVSYIQKVHDEILEAIMEPGKRGKKQ